MIHKDRNARRFFRARAINRKSKILYDLNSYHDNIVRGALSKNKIHCSCAMCSCKSSKFKSAKRSKGFVSYNPKNHNWYPTNDKRRLEKANSSLEEYNLIIIEEVS